MKNLALDKPALQSSTSVWSRSQDPSEEARGANNGTISRELGFHTAREKDPWWQVDLESVSLIHRVEIFNRRHMAERLRFFSILMSMDGSTWRVVYTKREPSIFGGSDDFPFTVNLSGGRPARFVRVRLNGIDSLHFNELQVFGESISESELNHALAEARSLEKDQAAVPLGREGRIINIGGFVVFADTTNYDADIVAAFDRGVYEGHERSLIPNLLSPGQRVLEVGTAAGVVTMTAASIVGPENVTTFEANPDILADARENFRRNEFANIDARFGVLQNIRVYEEGRTLPFGVARQFWSSRLGATFDDPAIKSVIQVPTFCLEREILAQRADVLICDIEGGEADLLGEADLPGVSLVLMETHYRYAGQPRIDAMIRAMVMRGFSIDLAISAHEMVVLRR